MLLEAQARSIPGAPFLVFDDLQGRITTRTYREFARKANRAAHLLLRLGIRRGDTAALLLANCLDFLALGFGAARIGQIVVRGEPGLSLMKGYLQEPEATAETIRDGTARTPKNAYV